MEKPGYKTTEAWVSALSALFLLAVSYGLLSQAQSDSLMDLIAPALPLLLSIVPTVVYTVQRTGLKKETVKAEASAVAAKAELARMEAMMAMAAPMQLQAAAQPWDRSTFVSPIAPDQPEDVSPAGGKRLWTVREP